jgi:hypothetical protein
MQAAGEGLVRVTVADKAGIELERRPDQRFDISNKIFRDARPSEEDFGNLAVRAIKRVNADGRRSAVDDGL